MILEMDCGNSFIKWRLVRAPLGVASASGIVKSATQLLGELASVEPGSLAYCRFVSVRGEKESRRLAELIRVRFGIPVAIAESAKVLAGVQNGYDDYKRLGLDRWLALVAAYKLSAKACIVFDLGTAVTCDFVDSSGVHVGGYICPGIPLMRNQLRTHTNKIRYNDALVDKGTMLLGPGRNTAQAVERGCLLMMRHFVASQVLLASEYLGDDVDVLLTGGDAFLAADAVPYARLVPDLVFKGLAIACPAPGDC
jgi:type III pantothenate kinase